MVFILNLDKIALIKGQHVNTNKYDGHIWKFKKFKYMNIRGSLSLNTNKVYALPVFNIEYSNFLNVHRRKKFLQRNFV